MSFPEYLRQVQQQRQSGSATEPSYYDALKALILSLDGALTVTIQPGKVRAGAPDLAVAGPTGVIGYLEAKDLNAPLDEVEKSEQLRRYRQYLPNLILTDFLEFRWYVDGERRETARLGTLGPNGAVTRDRAGVSKVREMLRGFLDRQPAPVEDPADLAQRLARLAHLIRDTVVEAFRQEHASDMLRDLRRSFARTLLPDLDKPENVGQFADMYAQTIAYGLFAAAVHHQGPGPFRRRDAAREIPRTNPFLRRLFEIITGLQMEEEPYAPFVDDLADILGRADMDRVLEHFARRTGQEDAVVHFYETFLQQYDPRLREMRGVYYTPQPVVSYIVRSVDYLLRTRFGLPDGLADTATLEYQYDDNSGALPRKVTKTSPKVLVLDPACGTGTFLYQVVDLIRERFRERGNAGMWSAYVREHLLRRLFGFELLMAPYAVAHLKLGMQLAGLDLEGKDQRAWSYDFAAEERLGVYLTNTLEEVEGLGQLPLPGAWRVLAEEGRAAAAVKRDLPIMAIIGNPPYSGHSANRSWAMESGKRVPTFIGRLIQDYYRVDGEPLGERNPKWLQDDYVKFIRWAQWRIERTGAGVLAFISNHGYLDNPTFRGMRQALMNAFTDIYVLDLHGNSKKKEVSPDGSPDQNVFDIQQGVAIGIFVKEPGRQGPATVNHADLWGPRAAKYSALQETEFTGTDWKPLQPRSPFYLFVPQDVALWTEYEAGWKVTDALPVNVLGFQTHRDDFAIAFTEREMRERISALRDPRLSDASLRERFGLRDNRDWQLATARSELMHDTAWERSLTTCLYRPFDWRYCYFSSVAMDFPRRELVDHVLRKHNLCLLSSRQQATTGYRHSWVAGEPANDCAVSTTSREANQVMPLYVNGSRGAVSGLQGDIPTQSHWPAGPGGRTPNLDPAFVADLETRLGLAFVPDGTGDLEETFGPEDVFHYLYAVLHSPTYRDRYAQFLKTDFPRVPLTSDVGLFRELCRLGAELTALHLLESPVLAHPFTSFPVPGGNEVAKGHPKYLAPGEPEPGSGRPLEKGRVYINETQYFQDVPPEAWEFHVGGYQVGEKWLKDRKGRVLTYDDLQHYRKVVLALRETVRLMEEVDAAIPAWPIE